MIRCSSLPLITKCPAAAIQPVTKIEGDNEMGRLGTAVHESMRRYITCENIALHEIADEHHVDMADLVFLHFAGVRIWQNLREHFPDPTCEVEFTGLAIGGRVDVVSYDRSRRRISVLDWKTGYQDLDHWPQLKGYASLAMLNAPFETEEVYMAVARLREESVDGILISTPESIDNTFAPFIDSLSQIGKQETYNPGSWCGDCPRGHECTAKTSLLSQIGTMLAFGTNNIDWRKFPKEHKPAMLGAMFDACKLYRQAIDICHDLVKAEVSAAGGELPIGDGRLLEIVEGERSAIDYEAGESVLRKWLGDQLPKALSVSKTTLQKMVDRGFGQMLTELHEANALKKSVFEKLEVKQHVTNTNVIGIESAEFTE